MLVFDVVALVVNVKVTPLPELDAACEMVIEECALSSAVTVDPFGMPVPETLEQT